MPLDLPDDIQAVYQMTVPRQSYTAKIGLLSLSIVHAPFSFAFHKNTSRKSSLRYFTHQMQNYSVHNYTYIS